MATPTCAPSVTPSGSANTPSRAKRRASHGPIAHTPPVAPTDSQNPTDHTSSGSIIDNPITASASRRTGDRSRPDTNAVADSTAITPARRIDGSNRVSATNQAISPTVSSHLGHGRSRTRSGPHAARTKRDVLSGHGGQVRQPARPEPLDHVAGLISVVTDHETAEQGVVRLGDQRRGAFDRRPDPVRRPRQRAAGSDVARPVEIETPDDVLRGDTRRPLAVERLTLATHAHQLATPPPHHPLLLRAPP